MQKKGYFPGLVFVLSAGLFSLLLATLHPSFDALVISIILGMFAGNIINRSIFTDGTDIGIRFLLPAGIALYGMQLSTVSLNPGLVFSILVVFCALFGLTFFLSRVFNLNRTTSLLLSTGLSVCGATAITVVSPLIGAKKEETSISIVAVMMTGLTGMLLYPIIFDFFPITASEFNFISGSTLPMLGQVKVAASAYCPDCVEKALQIKLIRVSFLIFLAPAAALAGNRGKKALRLPWFIIVFVILAGLVNVVPALQSISGTMKHVSTFCLASGLAAIGFSVDLNALIEKGFSPFVVVFSSWLVILILIYLFRNVI